MVERKGAFIGPPPFVRPVRRVEYLPFSQGEGGRFFFLAFFVGSLRVFVTTDNVCLFLGRRRGVNQYVYNEVWIICWIGYPLVYEERTADYDI